jgi:regulatory protein
VVEQLQSERLVSDERFIETAISSLRRRGRGPLRVRQALQRKGIPAEAVDRSLGGGEEWLEVLREVIRKKFGNRPPKDYAERAKRARFLQGRGFSFDQIQRVLDLNDPD